MNKLNFIKKNKAYICLIIIFCVALFLRLYRLSDIYVFNLDEEHQAVYAWTLIKDFHLIWIGLSASPMEFYLGPYFTYFTALLLSISKGDPIITAYFAALAGSLTTALIFIVAWRLFSLTAGVISSILYGTLPLFVFFDQKYWNPMFIPFIIVLLYLTFNLIKKNKWWWIVYVSLLGIVLNTQLAPLPLFLIGVWIFIKEGYFKDLKLFLVCLLTFLLFYWPLIVFDYNHNFSNMKSLAPFFKKSEVKFTFDPITKFNSLFDSLGRFWYLKSGSPNSDEINFGCTSLSHANDYEVIDKYTQRTRSPLWLSIISISLFVLFYRLQLKKKNSSLKLLFVFFLVFISFFIIYPGGAFEYYYLGFLTLFTLVPGILIANARKKLKLFLFIMVGMISLIGINTILKTSDEFSLRPKKLLISQVMNIVGNEPFSIEGRGICHNYEGWRYLFKIYGRMPNISYTDKILGWIYPEEIINIPSVYTIILSEDRIPLKEDLSNLPSIKEGGYRAYIRKNSL